jgi:hypothetical protein
MNPNHSPSRERVERYRGGLRRYFRVNAFEDRKVFYTLVAVIASILMLGLWMVLRSDRPYSHGPVAEVHSAFDAQCEKCHKPPSERGSSSLFDPQSRWMALECQTCHRGPVHHRDMLWPSDWPKQNTGEPMSNDAECAACHHDHNGKTFSLTRVTDDHCVKCHGDLPKWHKAGATEYAAKIDNFWSKDGGHPEFRQLEAEKKEKNGQVARNIRFSHAHHMSPGIGYTSDGKLKVTKKDLIKGNKDDPKIVSQYFDPKDPDDAVVQLDCKHCHQLDAERGDPRDHTKPWANLAGEPRESIQPPRAQGAYFLPINYEAHCQACHPLKAPSLTSDLGQELDEIYLPHRKQPSELKEVLRARYSAAILSKKGKPELLNKNVSDEEVLKVGSQIDEAVRKAVLKLLPRVNPAAVNAIPGGTCTECHKLEGNSAKVEESKIVVPNIPTVWFEHAKFDHVAHRAYDCLSCHPNTGKPKEFDFKSIYTGPDQKINILGVESCRECHAPQGQGRKADGSRSERDGVRNGCADCHRYHNGDFPLQGLGAAARDPKTKLK